MNNRSRIHIKLLLCIAILQGILLAADVEIAYFRYNKKAAASFTFDDALSCAFDKAAPLFDMYGYKITEYIQVNRTFEDQWPHWREIAQNGHEVSNHTWTHQNGNMDVADYDYEIKQAADSIYRMTGIFPMSFAYPGCKYTERCRKYILDVHPLDRICGKLYVNGQMTIQAARHGRWTPSGRLPFFMPLVTAVFFPGDSTVLPNIFIMSTRHTTTVSGSTPTPMWDGISWNGTVPHSKL
ncbi:MAG: polysaccharide deacetylase family protein [Chitinivibrionales bacterium]|nr:polysaccharide deacetylase family protein [Chitinivibrionales bacterium]